MRLTFMQLKQRRLTSLAARVEFSRCKNALRVIRGADRYLDTVDVWGSNPQAPTIFNPGISTILSRRAPNSRELVAFSLAWSKERYPFAAAEDPCHTSGHQRRQRSGQQGS